jgi:putative ABC transport system substrate-binding protein
MKRRAFLAALALAGSAHADLAVAQSPRAPARIAILTLGSNPSRPVFEAFRAELRERGHVEGRDIAIEFHMAHGSLERLAALAQAIVRTSPTVVLADGGAAASAIHAATREIPIVAVGSIDPMVRALAASLARPGGNLTGIATFNVELTVKQLELLHEIVPSARRAGVVGIQTDQARRAFAQAAEARRLVVRFIASPAAADVGTALAPAALADVDGLVLSQNPALTALSGPVVERINAGGKPAVYAEREYLESGGLVTYGIDFVAIYRRLAGYVDRVLRGASPAEMPIERPERLELAVNLRTARALAITIPPSVLTRADEVIE